MLKELLQKRDDIAQRMLDLQQDIEPRMASLREEANAVNIDINHAISQKLIDIRSLTGKEYGVVHLSLDGYKITETIPKKVEWDQVKLTALYDRIAAAGDNPRSYMKMELKVGEKEYEKFDDPIKAVFQEARTVKPGTPSVKFEEVASA